MDPPTLNKPPEVLDSVDAARDDWAECVVSFSDDKSATDASEVWVFRKRDYGEFQRLIGLRLSYRPQASGAGASPQGAARFGTARRAEAMEGTKVTCRDRSVDPEIKCGECVRVFTGGAYKDKAISVPAFPAQPAVLDCLALSVGEASAEADLAAEQVREDEDKPAAPVPPPQLLDLPLRQTAFCNSVNARFAKVEA